MIIAEMIGGDYRRTVWGYMYTTILAYVIAFLGLVMIGTGV
jgi:hypothetical protein